MVCDDRPVTASTLITVAPTGAETPKADVLALPVTVEEIAATARDCQAVGASVVHLHIRDAETRPTLDLGYVCARSWPLCGSPPTSSSSCPRAGW